MRVRGSFGGPCAAALFAAAASAQPVLIVSPNTCETTEGDNNNFFPFAGTSAIIPSQHYQQVHESAQFAALAGRPHRLTRIRMRPDALILYGPWSNTVTLDLRFSTTAAREDMLSTTFASNVGPDETIVYTGEATYGTAQTATPPGPMQFDITIDFRTPFVYDPTRGNLLMEVRRDGGTMSGTRSIDANNVAGDGVSRLFTVSGPSNTPVAQGGDSLGLVVQFTFEPISAACYANCDNSTTNPFLNVNDFVCFQSRFAAGDSYANCDNSTLPPLLNVNDFVCFQGRFAAGCSAP